MSNNIDWIIHFILPGARDFTCNAHTHGMAQYDGQPDFQVVLNLGEQEIDRILNTLGLRVQAGERFSPGDFVEGIYEDCRLRLDAVEETGRTVLRVVIPDKNNLFPEDEGVMEPYSFQTLPTDDLVASSKDCACNADPASAVQDGFFSASFDMRIKGKKEDVITALCWLECSYDFEPRSGRAKEMRFSSDTFHIGNKCSKFHTVDYDTSVKAAADDATVIAKVSGECILTAKDGLLCDMEDEKTLSLIDACKKLNITAEVFSDGGVSDKAEHIIVGPEGLVCSEESQLQVFDFEDYPDYAAFKAAAGDSPLVNHFTEEMFDLAKNQLGVPGVAICDFFTWEEPYEWKWTLNPEE